ncbi:MAG: hypothetical protein AB7E95_13285, partial [Kiritimatiellales bacterium]
DFIDSDGDGLPDWWELLYFGSEIEALAMADPDSDGLTNLEEYLFGTNPCQPDTDEDGMPDCFEVEHGLNPSNPADALADPDSDGLTNLDEYLNNTNPMTWDSDSDGVSDGSEALAGSDPTAVPENAVQGTVWLDGDAVPAGAFKIQIAFNTNEVIAVSAGVTGALSPREICMGQSTEYASGLVYITYLQSKSLTHPTGPNALASVLFRKVSPESVYTNVQISVGSVLKRADDGLDSDHAVWIVFKDLSAEQ